MIPSPLFSPFSSPAEKFPLAILKILRELSEIPYENLSKIVGYAESQQTEKAVDFQNAWLQKAAEQGLGGTCFSLTYHLHERLQAIGFASQFIMGDKITQKNIHCGLLIDWDAKKYLLDPGYLIYDPLLLPENGLVTQQWVAPNAIRLDDGVDYWRLYTGKPNELKHRFDFRKQAVGEAEFIQHWESSYAFEMMNYPVLNKVTNGVQYYLQKRNLMIRDSEGSKMLRLSEEQWKAAAQKYFGVSEALAQSALGIILKKNKGFFTS